MGATMPSGGAADDRNLLFAVLALQTELIDRKQFIEICVVWAARRDVTVPDLLLERGWLTPEDRADVDRLLRRKVCKHGDDVRASLAAALDPELRASLARADNPALRESLSDILSLPPPASAAGLPGQALARPSLDAGHVVRSGLTVEAELRKCYVLVQLHGKGGLGQVWQARDTGLGREVALTELRSEAARSAHARARFLEEARVSGQLEHPGVVPIYEVAQRTSDGQPFYTMRFVRGRTLSEAIAVCHGNRAAGADDAVDRVALLTAFVAVCNTVAYAHARGVVHRDLKGSNVMLGDFGEVVVLDWGLAKVLGKAEGHGRDPEGGLPPIEPGSSLTLDGDVLGTPAYMAPEQAAGRWDLVGPRSDVYSLGALLYEIVCGRAPFDGRTSEDVLRRVREEEPVPPRQVAAGVPPALEAVCLKALAKSPGGRFASARELADEVRRFLADEPPRCYREPLPARALRWTRKHRTAVAAVVALLVLGELAHAVGTFLIDRERRQTRLAQAQAERYFQKASDALDTIVKSVAQETPALGPKGDPLRQAVLDSTTAFFRGFADEEATSPVVRLEAGRAYRRVAEAHNLVGHNGAAQQFGQEAVALLDELARGLPAPKHRYELAVARLAQARILQAGNRYEDSLAAVAEARRLLDGLMRERAAIPDSRYQLVECCVVQSYSLHGLNRIDEEEPILRELRARCEELLRDDPTDVHYRLEQARTYHFLGKLTAVRASQAPAAPRRRALLHEAVAHEKRAASLFAELEKDRQLLSGEVLHGYALNNIGYELYALAQDGEASQWAEAESTLREAVRRWQDLAGRYPGAPEYQAALGLAQANLASVLLDKPDTAAVECVRVAAEADANIRAALKPNPRHPDYLRYLRVPASPRVRALLRLGRLAEAERVAEQFAGEFASEPDGLYDAACLFALAAGDVGRAAGISDGERAARKQRSADRAMELLREACAKGYKDWAHMRADEDLKVLRGRADFQKLQGGARP